MDTPSRPPTDPERDRLDQELTGDVDAGRAMGSAETNLRLPFQRCGASFDHVRGAACGDFLRLSRVYRRGEHRAHVIDCV